MNEILKQRIEEAAKKYADKIEEQNPNSEAYNIDGNFIAGAIFALQNQWISVKEALPQKDDLYFVLIDGLHPRVTEFENGNWQGYNNITHWMEIPKNK